MRLKLKELWHLRPRLLTVALVAIVGAMIVLANLTDEFGHPGDVFGENGEVRFSLRGARPVDAKSGPVAVWSLSYGWPLRWRQFVVLAHPMTARFYGMTYSAVRVATDLAIWFVMLTVLATLCEWRLRRRRRFNWSLRTMLVGVTLAAALCGWFAAARDKAGIQDAIIAAERSDVWVKRWRLAWIELLGVERYFRTIVGVGLDLRPSLTRGSTIDEEDLARKKELVARLAKLRDLRYLFVDVNEHNHGLVDALRDMRRLKVLSIGVTWDSAEDRRLAHDLLTVVGGMRELEHLSLDAPPCLCEDLACLAGLKNLKSLHLVVDDDGGRAVSHTSFLAQLPPLPRLETVELDSAYVGPGGLRYLAVLPRLKRLNLKWIDVGERDLDDLPPRVFDPGLAGLARLAFLEEVSVDGDIASVAGLESLLALKHLKKLHISGTVYDRPRPFQEPLALDDGTVLSVYEDEFDRYRDALKALRQANPEFTIDGHTSDWLGSGFIPPEYETIRDDSRRAFVLNSLHSWQTQIKAGVPAAAKDRLRRARP